MILLHAMEAPYDLPGIDIRRGDTMYHLLSDIPGNVGTAELLAFVRECGGHDSWMQAAGTYREHFDIFGEWAERARELGARLADGHEVARILTHKRAALAQTALAVPALTSRQMRGLDHLLTATYGITPTQRMELAATRLAELARQMMGGAVAGLPITVLVGPGRTGATGLVAARLLLNAGAQVTVWLPLPVAALHQEGQAALATARACGVRVAEAPLPTGTSLGQSALVVEALLGAGTRAAPSGPIAEAIHLCNAAEAPTLALDLPTGLDPNEAGPLGPCVRATATLALGLPLRGLTLTAAAECSGEVWLGDVGIPRRAPKHVGARVGQIFATTPLVRLDVAPLAGDALASEVRQLRVAAAT
ncbi:MAG: DUF4031 domain-containing protein [Ktedonobacterales bacterium]|nr:DUF4031 domain-containing protein [Ktedonobacterales bacterium]